MNQEIKLPPLPETEYLLGIPARPYESEWISSDSAWDDSAMQAYATAAVELDRAQRGEPVAWRAWFDKDSGARWLFSLWPDEENKGLEVDWQPLYTAPQPERKPMSDVKAYALAGAVFPYSQHAKCLELIRDVESHHGIKP